MPSSKFEANPTLRRGVKHASFSLFTLASSCANAYFRAYAIIDFLGDRLVFLNTVTYNMQLFRYGVSNLSVQSLKSLGKGSFWWRGQRVLQIIRLNTLADVIRVPKVCTSGE